MQDTFMTPPRRNACCAAVSAALLLMAPQYVRAQATTTPAAPSGTGDVAQVLVVGTRASERTATQLKKNSRTAQDSIVADDVGSLPDRNVAEAISRIAGVNLDRDEYGEGNTVTVRGNSPDLTRVEVDGIGAVNGGGTDLNGGGEGRGVSLQDMPAELIASVDIVKGATADMTEGSLGGTILIKTRTGLDFKKRTIVARASAVKNTLSDKTTPSLNLIFADNYLDGRLGVVANLSKTDARNEAHSVSQNSGTTGSYNRLVDFDHSPEKTFSYTTDALSRSDGAVNTPIASWAKNAASGGGRVSSLSPYEILSRSGAAQSKEACYAAFPLLQSADLVGLSSGDNARARNQRIDELRTCLGQWNDYSPILLRNVIRRSHDERTNADLRVDIKVNNNLTVYAKYNRNDRTLTEDILNFSLGDMAFNSGYTDTITTAANGNKTAARNPNAGSNYYFFDTPTNAGSTTNYSGLTNGQTVNVIPGSVVVDANHHVTAFRLANAGTNTDQILTEMENNTRTKMVGANWRSGGFKAELLAARTTSDFNRFGWRSNLSAGYGAADVSITPAGLWVHKPVDATFDQSDPSRYGQLSSSAVGMPLRTPGTNGTQLTLDNPRANSMSETTLKADATWSVSNYVPYLQNVKFGLNRRKQDAEKYGQGLQVSTNPNIWVPETGARSFYYGCQDTTQSAGTVNACKYGVRPAAAALSNPRDAHDSVVVMTPAEYNDIVKQIFTRRTNTFFGGARDRQDSLVNGWTEIDLKKLWELTNAPYMDPRDCMRECLANDGNVYSQPVNRVSEKVTAGYLSTDFGIETLPGSERELPFGVTLEGNFGWRYVKTTVSGTSATTFTAVTPNPTPGGANLTSSFRRNSTLTRDTTDIMPILNLALWAVPDQFVVRYNRAKQIARPPLSRLTGDSVVCRNDYTQIATGDEEDDTMNCNGTMGNPGLQPQVNKNQNLSLEWYVNNDTMISAAAFRNKGIIGAAQRVTVIDRPFAGTGELDPLGNPLDDIAFSYQTWENGPALLKKGIEFSGKTAFTFLPSVLRYTGISGNYTRLRSSSLEGQYVDLLTATPLDPVGQQKYSWNTALWYDDGALSMRLALQVTAATFSRIASDDAFSNFPAAGVTAGSLPYHPAPPLFRDARRFVDAKIAYKFKNGLEVFAEGRNIGKSTTSVSNGGFAPFADGTPSLSYYTYGGAQYMAGLVLRY